MEGAANIRGLADGGYLDEGHGGWGFKRGCFGERVGYFINCTNT